MSLKSTAIFSILLILLLSPSSFAGTQEERGLRVTEAVICRDVVDRTPQGTGEVFPSSVGKLFAFTRIEGATGETNIKHLWFFNDRLMAEVSLPVRSANWRTYSSKRILPQWTGSWRVDITTEDGLLLKSLHFRIE